MIEATDSIKEQLIERAYEESYPFCYSDYKRVEANEDGEYKCPKCGSDDLMREFEGVIKWGADWIVEHLVKEEGEEVDIVELYRDVFDEIYEPVRFGELEYSASMVLESVDTFTFEIRCSEYADSELDEGRLIELNGSFYRMTGITD